jgi:hypothetical protein
LKKQTYNSRVESVVYQVQKQMDSISAELNGLKCLPAVTEPVAPVPAILSIPIKQELKKTSSPRVDKSELPLKKLKRKPKQVKRLKRLNASLSSMSDHKRLNVGSVSVSGRFNLRKYHQLRKTRFWKKKLNDS